MTKYNKPPLTFQQQVDLLKSRGMLITDIDRTIRHLSNISYYRLSAYMYPYKKRYGDIVYDQFIDGTTWNKVYDLYLFDRKLRQLIFDAIERIEVAVRCKLIYHLSHKYGSHWQDRQEIFKEAKERTLKDGTKLKVDIFAEIQKHIKEQMNSKKPEDFIAHYKEKYDKPVNPPSWMSIETLYFSQLSKICSNLKNRKDVTMISKDFALPPQTLCSWLHALNYVRNLCAHHTRLWNRTMDVVPEKLDFSKQLTWISNADTVKRSKVYYFLCMLNYLLQSVNPTSSICSRLRNLLGEYSQVISLSSMGFPDDWKEEKLWGCLK